MEKFTFVTISHQIDYQALCLQARSMALYLPADLVEKIIIIENPELPDHKHLIGQYGNLANRVEIIKSSNLLNIEVNRSGWWSQQILKLLVASRVTTPAYVTLDTKNHLVYPLTRDFLVKNNKPRTYIQDYRKHSSRRWIVNSLRYFDLSDKYIKAFFPTTTPFVLMTGFVRALIYHVETREQKPFPVVFGEKQFTEFFLYGAFLVWLKRMCYDLTAKECKTIWDVHHSNYYVGRVIRQTEKYKLPFFSVHRRAIPLLSEKSKKRILEFWSKHGLDGHTLFSK